MQGPANSFYLVNYFPAANYWEEHNDLFKTTNVIIKATSREVRYPRHWGTLSVKTVLNGHECYVEDGNEYKVNEYNYLVLNHDQHYGSYIREAVPVDSLSLHFTKSFERSVLSCLYRSHERLVDDPFHDDFRSPEFAVTQHRYNVNMRNLVLSIKELIIDLQRNAHAVEEKYYQLYTEIFKAQFALEKAKQKLNVIKKTTRDEIFNRVLIAKNYLEDNYEKADLSLASLARAACMNPFHLLRCFKQAYNLTPYQYVKQLRLERAFQLLLQKKYTVSEVVNLCGYEDICSFGRTFKTKFGITPSKI